MKRPLLAAAVLFIACAAGPSIEAQQAKAKPKVLFFSKSSGFEHPVIKWGENKSRSHVETILDELGARHGFEFVHSKDGSLFSPEYFKPFDAVFFYTSGDLTKPGTDKMPPMTLEGKQALLDAVRSGMGLIGTHACSDSFHSPGERHQNNSGADIDPFLALLGGEFIVHGAQQKSKTRVVDRTFPGLEAREDFVLHEEWYAMKNFAPDLHVLLVQETEGMAGPMYQRPPFPSTWIREDGQGRVFYTTMGHREDIWTNPIFQELIVGALQWTTGQKKADARPNVQQVAPKASELPAQR